MHDAAGRVLRVPEHHAAPACRSGDLAKALLDEAGVAVLSGTAFGKFGEGYLRLSYANSIPNLEKALERMGEFLASAAHEARARSRLRAPGRARPNVASRVDIRLALGRRSAPPARQIRSAGAMSRARHAACNARRHTVPGDS